LSIEDLSALTYFFIRFAGPHADRIAAKLPVGLRNHREFMRHYHQLDDLLKRAHHATGASQMIKDMTLRQRVALGKKIAAAWNKKTADTWRELGIKAKHK
jgi:hypothetical protein